MKILSKINFSNIFRLDKRTVPNILLLIVILLSFITNDYAINNTNFMRFLYIEKVKYVIYLLLFVSFILQANLIKITKKEILNISIIIIFTYLFLFIRISFRGIEVEMFIKVLLVLPLFFYNNLNLNYKRFIYIMLYVFLFFALLYANDRAAFEGYMFRLIYNSFDPNISSMYLLLGFFLARKINAKVLMIVFLIMGVATLSRNFLLAIIFLYLFTYIKKIQLFKTILKINFISLLIILNIIIIGLSYGFQYISYSEGSSRDTSRFTNLADQSNADRFSANTDVINESFSSIDRDIFGLGLDYYSNTAYNTHRKAHNGTLDFFAMYGIVYTLLYFSLLYFIFNKVKNYENIEYVFSYGVFSLFLTGLLGGVYLILFIFILKFKGYQSLGEKTKSRAKWKK